MKGSESRAKNPTSYSPSYRRRRIISRWVALISLILIAVAWFIGYRRGTSNVSSLVKSVLPGTNVVESQGDLFVGRQAVGGPITGYAAVGVASGYGGPIDVLVGVSPEGEVLGLRVVQQHDTPGFFRLLQNQGFYNQYVGQSIDQPLYLGQKIHAVSGASFSSQGVADGVIRAIQTINSGALHMTLPPRSRSLHFGIPEVILILLFVSGYFGHRLHNPQWKRRIRWGTLLTGMIGLGFIYTAPLTIANIISLLSGYWPDYHNNLYWYLLIGGVVFVTTTQGENPYCSWFCPFGAFQECLAAISGAKSYRPRRLHRVMQWVQRGLALTAVLLGLAFRMPGGASFEPFATLFDLRGSIEQWALLVTVVLASIFIYRPFCGYLCPVAPVVDLIGEGRRFLHEVWLKWKKPQKTS